MDKFRACSSMAFTIQLAQYFCVSNIGKIITHNYLAISRAYFELERRVFFVPSHVRSSISTILLKQVSVDITNEDNSKGVKNYHICVS